MLTPRSLPPLCFSAWRMIMILGIVLIRTFLLTPRSRLGATLMADLARLFQTLGADPAALTSPRYGCAIGCAWGSLDVQSAVDEAWDLGGGAGRGLARRGEIGPVHR